MIQYPGSLPRPADLKPSTGWRQITSTCAGLEGLPGLGGGAGILGLLDTQPSVLPRTEWSGDTFWVSIKIRYTPYPHHP